MNHIGHIGFLKKEESLASVDADFRELVRQAYCIPGFGSYGISCSGHMRIERDLGMFFPELYGHLGIAALPQLEHIPELLRILYDITAAEQNARIWIVTKTGQATQPRWYCLNTNLELYSQDKTSSGLPVARLEIRINDNGCLSNDYNGQGFSLEQTDIFEATTRRYKEIKAFWKKLEERVQEFNSRHGFQTPDFKKEEFLPFR